MNHIVCLGYAKCGTTMLDQVFRRSQSVATPVERKEIKFFLPPQFPAEDAHDEYLSRFHSGVAFNPSVQYTFEASPPYCHQDSEGFSAVLDRIKSTLPGAQLVICVRHPVARAYSHYIHNLHKFGLYGDGVYGKRAVLPKRVFVKSFQEALHGPPSLLTKYSENLKIAYDRFGHDNVNLFFLERDINRFSSWVGELTSQEVVDELGLEKNPPSLVIPRRPVPNYSVQNEVLLAFGSRSGEFVRYEGLSPADRRNILSSRKHWTLEVEADEVKELARRYFADDLEECSRLTGEDIFQEYLSYAEPQTATLTPGSVLREIHLKAGSFPISGEPHE